MNVTKTIRTTYATEQRIEIEPPEYESARGLRYWPDIDDEAAKRAKPFFDRATNILRMSAKDPEAPVSMSLQRRGDEVWAVCELTTKTRA